MVLILILQRHILVKGCGKDPHSESDHSRIIKSESSAPFSASHSAKDDDGSSATPPSATGSRKGSNGGI